MMLNDEGADLKISEAASRVAATDAFNFAAQENVHTHGGIGFTKDYKIQLYFRRQKRAELSFGDADYHRELVAQQLGI